MSIPVAFVAASVIEAVAIHFLVPWQWLRVVLLVATVLSLIAIGGWLAGRVVHPHLVSARTVVFVPQRAFESRWTDHGFRGRAWSEDSVRPQTRLSTTAWFYRGPTALSVDVGFDRPRLGHAPETAVEGV